jgi:RNA polymerase sigma-70 factor, ECF subfamily
VNVQREIIERIQGGDEQAFAILIDQYKERAMRQAYFYCQNWEDAKDISQKAFIKAYRKIRGFRGQANFYTWFYRILINSARDFQRRQWWFRWRVQPRQTEEGVWDPLNQVVDTSPRPLAVTMDKELLSQLDIFLAGLPSAQHDVIVLRYGEELSLEEIAERLGKAIGTVKAQLFAVHQKLRKKLANDRKGGQTDGR